MRTFDIIRAWGKILTGHRPSISIEITRECPLRCPGCYAYDPNHLDGVTTLRQLNDFKGQELIDGIIELVDRYRPLHLSIVGGDPLVRYRELQTLLPLILMRRIHVQLVTSAFRPIPAEWVSMRHLTVLVSIDGLAPEHDVRRAPATYDRILKNIAGQRITVHCTITGQMMKRPGYLEEFLAFWTPREEVNRVWFSIFTPQQREVLPEILSADERGRVISELLVLRQRYQKLDMRPGMIERFAAPPSSPERCVFAQTTHTISADLTTVIKPCQFGGQPDCSSCGCIASMGLDAIAHHKLGGLIPVGDIFWPSLRIGRAIARPTTAHSYEFQVLH